MCGDKSDELYLIHIEERIERIEEVAEEGREAFMQSRILQDVVIRNFEVIGEAVKRISPSLLDQRTDVPWHRVAGFRDVLLRDYMGVDVEEVWNVIENNLPQPKRAITKIRRPAGNSDAR